MTDRASLGRRPEQLLLACVEGGVDRIQLRDRNLDGQAWLAFAEEVQQTTQRVRPEIEIIVNRRVDVALAIGATGVHLGFDALPLEETRALLGERALIGVSTHSVDEAIAAHRAGADYIHLAPIHPPLSKPSTRPPLGIAPVLAAASAGLAVFAQGGIGPGQVPALVAAGVAGVAVTGSLLQSGDPYAQALALRRALQTDPEKL